MFLPCAISNLDGMKTQQQNTQTLLWYCGRMLKERKNFYDRIEKSYYSLTRKIRSGMRNEFIWELMDIIRRSQVDIPKCFGLLLEAANAQDNTFELYALAFMSGVFSEKKGNTKKNNNQTNSQN